MKPYPIHTPNAPQAIGPYSQAMGLGDLIFTSGSIALQANGEFVQGGIKEQSEQVMQNLQAVLEASRSGLEYVLKTTCFLADMGISRCLMRSMPRHLAHTSPRAAP